MEVIDDAIQIMGGLGYTDEARVSRFWRDVRCERIGGGTDEIMIYVAGRQIPERLSEQILAGGAAS
ncbi:acyl-CoA dehydrogenase family protein [Escherichia coli]